MSRSWQTDRAIALDPDNMRAYYVKSLYLLLTHRWNEALNAADAGLAINPNFAPLYATRGVAENSISRFEQAILTSVTSMPLSTNTIRQSTQDFVHSYLTSIWPPRMR